MMIAENEEITGQTKFDFSKSADRERFENYLRGTPDPKILKDIYVRDLGISREHVDFLESFGKLKKLREFYYQVLLFDIQNNTKTGGFYSKETLEKEAETHPEDFANPERVKNTVRSRSSLTAPIEEAFNQVVSIAQVNGYSLDKASFFDLGSGEGKPCLIAASRKYGYGFKRVVGIDNYKKVLEIANDNKKNAAETLDIDENKLNFVFADATEFSAYNGLNVVFMYNPYDEKIVSKVEDNLRKYGGNLILIYVRPKEKHLFTEANGWKLETERDHPGNNEWKSDKWYAIYTRGFEQD